MIRLILLPALIILIAVSSCKENSEKIPTEEGNALLNGSFEAHGAGWTSVPLTAIITYDPDVPDTGGNFSARISENWGAPYSLQQSVPVASGHHIVKLSCWGKTEGTDGTFGFTLNRSLEFRKAILITGAQWSYFSLTDTLDLSQNDTITVRLEGAFSQLASKDVFFDLCRLELD